MKSEDRFAQLIAPIQTRMFQTVWRVLRHSQDAEDALQVALTTIWKQLARIERHPAPQALMLKIMRRSLSIWRAERPTIICHHRKR